MSAEKRNAAICKGSCARRWLRFKLFQAVFSRVSHLSDEDPIPRLLNVHIHLRLKMIFGIPNLIKLELFVLRIQILWAVVQAPAAKHPLQVEDVVSGSIKGCYRLCGLCERDKQGKAKNGDRDEFKPHLL
jgi:hypothetical protein